MSDDTIRVLTNLKTKFETRQLSVGDFVWIARDQSGKELLLPYIVERKRMDDLGSSIKDGRFHEQKVIKQFMFLCIFILYEFFILIGNRKVYE